MLLLEKNEFSKALTEANKIFEMSWPENQEAILLKELLYLSDRFMHKEQTPLGLQLLETNQRMFKSAASQASIWKEKGYLYKKMNQADKALECFREAQRLEQSRPR
jgi:tetratricopeptide (TPR) repeat protein